MCRDAGCGAAKDVIEHELAYEYGPSFTIVVVDGAVFLLDLTLDVGSWALGTPHYWL